MISDVSEDAVTCAQCGTSHQCSDWSRTLWRRPRLPDNFTPASFLSTITTAPIVNLDYGDLLVSTLVLASRLSLLIVFVAVFYATYHRVIAVAHLTAINAACLMVGVVAHSRLGDNDSGSGSSLTLLMSLSLSVLLLFLLSPLLSTLTRAYSSDTIYSLAWLMALTHLLTFDYHHINSAAAQVTDAPVAPQSSEPVTGSLSLNAALTLSILLASRLESFPQAFSLLLLASIIFAALPVVQHRVRKRSLSYHCALCVATMVLASMCLACVSAAGLVAYWSAVALIVLVCPAYFKYAQQFKNEIHGPWDYDDEPENRPENL